MPGRCGRQQESDVHERRRKVYRIRLQQAIQNLLLDLCADGLVQLAAHVFLDFRAEVVEPALGHAELATELLIQLGEHLCLDPVNPDLELCGFPGQLIGSIIIGKPHIEDFGVS